MEVASLVWNGAVRSARALAVLLALASLIGPAHAHLMVAQKGTLNFSGDGAYLLLSLPVSALRDVDDDGDQRLSLAELRTHAGAIERQVSAGVQLHDDGRPLPLQGLMMNPSPPDSAPEAPASQLVVMGRYALGTPAHAGEGANYTFTLTLFGTSADERSHDISFTRLLQAHVAHFAPERTVHALFHSTGAIFFEQLRSGFEHVLAGLDHLLFLLVVLTDMVAARRGWRQALLALSCFTLGHAITLVASVHGGLVLSPLFVEPAIAVTIVAMAFSHLWQVRQARWSSHRVHLGLVFVCALIHGLGLSGAMGSQGLTGANLAWGLAGFNLGIEVVQVLVGGAAAAALAVMARRVGSTSPLHAGQLMSLAALLAGSWWFVERASAWV